MDEARLIELLQQTIREEVQRTVREEMQQVRGEVQQVRGEVQQVREELLLTMREEVQQVREELLLTIHEEVQQVRGEVQQVRGEMKQIVHEEVERVVRKEVKQIVHDDVSDQLAPVKGSVNQLLDHMEAIKPQVEENTLILRSLREHSEVNKAEHDAMKIDMAHMMGDVRGVKRSLSALEGITAYNWSEIVELKKAE